MTDSDDDEPVDASADPWNAGIWDRFERWAGELDQSFDRILKQADVAAPNKARASRSRMRKGGAPEVRGRLFAVLSELELKRSTRTTTGAVMLGVEEWDLLGKQLAALEPTKFLQLLHGARQHVEVAKLSAKIESPFLSIKPQEKSRAKK